MGKLKVKSVVELKNAPEILKQLEDLQKQSEKAVKATVSDFSKSVPGWVKDAVRTRYAVSPQQITGKARKGAKKKKMIGSVKVSGNTLDSAQVVYQGRPLTLSNFGLSPTLPKKTYTLKATILKGKPINFGKVKQPTKKQRKNIGRNKGKRGTRNSPASPIMLMPTKYKNENKDKYVSRQRRSQDRDDVETIKTVSLPQMVDNHLVREVLDKKIEEEMGKRLNKHLNYYLNKKSK